MARITKDRLKTQFQGGVTGDGTGTAQVLLDQPANAAFRRVLTGLTQPGGGMMAPRIQARDTGQQMSGETLFGDTVTRQGFSQKTIAPNHVSVEPFTNPFLDFIFDKIAEGTAKVHQWWQETQRVRGKTHTVLLHQHPLDEVYCTLPFQTMNDIPGQADNQQYGDVLQSLVKDFQTAPPSALAAQQFAAPAALKAALPAFFQGQLGQTLEQAQDWSQRVQTKIAVSLKPPTDKLDPWKLNSRDFASCWPVAKPKITSTGSGTLRVGKVGAPPPVYGDLGRYHRKIGPFPPGGQVFAGKFLFQQWETEVAAAQQRVRKQLPATLPPAFDSLAQASAVRLALGAKGGRV